MTTVLWVGLFGPDVKDAPRHILSSLEPFAVQGLCGWQIAGFQAPATAGPLVWRLVRTDRYEPDVCPLCIAALRRVMLSAGAIG